jgi:heterodisulfide reductase subunit B
MNKKYVLFLGCTIEARARNYEMAARKVAGVLGLELNPLDDFTCCGFPLKAVDQETTAVIAARNLALAERAGADIVTLCSACTGFLTETNHHLQHDEEQREKVNTRLRELGVEYNGSVNVIHFSRLLYQETGTEALVNKVTVPLEGLRFAPHYGCHYLKPSEVFNHVEDPEAPHSLDELIELTGAESVPYADKLLCCGGAVLAMDEKVSLGLSRRKLKGLKESQVDGMCLICPFCAVMYDDNQKKIEGMFEEEYNLPVLYYPQVLGLAMGIAPKELGLLMNKVKARELIAKYQALREKQAVGSEA